MKKTLLWMAVFAVMIFAGCDQEPEEKEDLQLTLTVTGDPTNITIATATLKTSTSGPAIATANNDRWVFRFFIGGDATNLFTEPGSYFITLSAGTTNYTYTGNGTSAQQYTFATVKDNTIPWTHFRDLSQQM